MYSGYQNTPHSLNRVSRSVIEPDDDRGVERKSDGASGIDRKLYISPLPVSP